MPVKFRLASVVGIFIVGNYTICFRSKRACYTKNMSDSSTVQNSEKTAKNQIITTASGGNNKFFKIALILLAIVMLIIISEVGYLIFTKKGASLFKFGQTAVQEEQGTPLANITPSPPPSLPKEETKSITVDSEKVRRFADLLDHFETSNKLDLFEEAITSFTITGVVVSARFEKKEAEGVEFVYLLQIQSETGSMATYRLTDQEILNAQISLSTNSGISVISITDINVGDNITLKETANVLDSSPHLSLKLKVKR